VAAVAAAEAAREKLAHDVVLLEMTEALGVVDAFVITSGGNRRQVQTIVEEIERRLGDVRPLSVEGRTDASWVLMDYGDFVVHVFLDETRQYFDLEHLWAAAPRLDWIGKAVGAPV
jgi:ribosome-associated protein